jgi:hypothetical protein
MHEMSNQTISEFWQGLAVDDWSDESGRFGGGFFLSVETGV